MGVGQCRVIGSLLLGDIWEQLSGKLIINCIFIESESISIGP